MRFHLGGRLPFLGIIDTVERVLAEHDPVPADALTLEDVLTTEAWAREYTRQLTGLAA